MTDSANATHLEVQLDFDAMVEDPHPVYDRLRMEQPCAWSPQLRSWIVTRYADVARVDRDTEAFSAVLDDDPATLVRGRAMTRTDGIEHRRLRKAAGAPLRPRVVEQQWAAIVAEHVNRHVARVDGPAHFDILGEFATPLMADVLIDVLGFEGVTADDVSRWSATFVAGVSAHEDDPAVWAAVRASREEVQAHVAATAERVRRTPDHTVVSAMLTASGGEPDLEEIGSNVRLLLSGGYNEPRDMIATLAWFLLAYPAERAGALASPEGLNRAIDEAVRWLTPLGATPRQLIRDTTVAGVPLRAGDRVLALFSAGNHDPEVFSEPHRFQPDRARLDEHMGFGRGAHFCLGVHLARQVMREAVPRLLMLPVEPLEEPRFRGWRFRAPVAVPVLRVGAMAPQMPSAPEYQAAPTIERLVVRDRATRAGEQGDVLCALADIPTDGMLRIKRAGRPPLAVALIDGEVLCIEDRCTHAGASLSEGSLDDGFVECPLHDSRFDLRTGLPDAPPARKPVRTHAVAVVNGLVCLSGDRIEQTENSR